MGLLLGLPWALSARTTGVGTEARPAAMEQPPEEAGVHATDLAPVEVEGHAGPVAAARAALDAVPGGTTLVEAGAFRDAPTSNLEDVVGFVPGVYAASRGGPETHLSIRGSGISVPWAVKGVRMLRNGLPIVEADGWYHSQLIEPLIVRYAEVYRGANALTYGASTLGGAINLVTYTGYDAPAFVARLEAGSDGHFHPQLASGNVLGGGWDYFVSLSSQHADGFREHTAGTHDVLYANLGHRSAAGGETRLHLSVLDSRQELVGALTRQQLHADPSQGDAGAFISYVDAQAMNKFRHYRVDVQHTRYFGADGRLDLGLFYGTQDVHHPLPFQLLTKHDLNTWGASVRAQATAQLVGVTHRFSWGGLWLRGGSRDREDVPLGGLFGTLVVAPNPPGEPRAVLSDVLSGELFAEDRIGVTPRLDVLVGAQLAYATRKLDVDVIGSALGDVHLDRAWTRLSPCLGLLWQATEDVQVFGNLSRSFEPPVLYEFRTAAGQLDAQHGTTLEVGTRGQRGPWHWELSVYRARIHDEILSAEVPPHSGQYVTANADRTVHSGVELGLDGRVPLGWAGDDALQLRLAWSWNRFRFDENASFGNHELPGVPRRFGRLEALYEHPSGFYVGPSVQTASAYYVDYANTLAADAYLIYGVRAGYRADHWSVFVEGVNVGDKVYVGSTSVIPDAGGRDQAVFNPGRPRSLFAGVQLQW